MVVFLSDMGEWRDGTQRDKFYWET